jgi:hypothetical protein
MEDMKFAHEALDKDANEVRLIALQSSPDSAAAIHCKILNARLSDNPQYEAISYMWGSDDNPQVIHIGEKWHSVTHNL